MNLKNLTGLFLGVTLAMGVTGCDRGPTEQQRERELYDQVQKYGREVGRVAFNFSERAKSLQCVDTQGSKITPESSAVMAVYLLNPDLDESMRHLYLYEKGIVVASDMDMLHSRSSGLFKNREEGLQILSQLDRNDAALVSAARDDQEIGAVFYNQPGKQTTMVVYGVKNKGGVGVIGRIPDTWSYRQNEPSAEQLRALVKSAGEKMEPGVYVLYHQDNYNHGMLDKSEWKTERFPAERQSVSVVTRTAEGNVARSVDIPQNPCDNGQKVAAAHPRAAGSLSQRLIPSL